MNNQDSCSAYYLDAYNSQYFMHQDKKPTQGFLRSVLTKGQHFIFSQANTSIALSAVEALPPSEMAEFESDKTKTMFWNEVRLTSESFSGWSQLYFFVAALAKVSLVIFLPLFYFMLFIGLIFGEGGWEERAIDLYWVTLYGLLPSLLIYGHFKLVNSGHYYLAPFLKSKLLFELNRKTGMVTLFKKGNKIHFSHPFIEFDCVLISAPSPQGHLNYSLALIHRYQDYAVGVPLHTIVGSNQNMAEYHRLWNMIQRYMDTSQPMPDIMILEPARKLDPVTAEYDKMHDREARYWRDMTDEEFKKTLDRIRGKQKNQAATGPAIDIFKKSEVA